MLSKPTHKHLGNLLMIPNL